MTLQATALLIQADWLPADYPLWDSSALLAEQSVAGQLLYALVGYEATPTALQLGAYLTAVLVILGAALLAARWQAADRAQVHVRAD
jgi:high-affinity iron transporter